MRMEARKGPPFRYERRSISAALTLRLRHGLADGQILLVNASSIVGTTLVTSVLGFAYWWVAARLLPPEAVGFAAACVSAMMLVANFSLLGIGTLLVGELPRRGGNVWPFIVTMMIPPSIVGAALGVLVAMGASRISTGLAPLADSPGSIALFAVGASLTAGTLVLDDAFLGLLRGQLQLQRNIALAVVKLIVLVLMGLWMSSSGGIGVYFSWVVGIFASIVVVVGIQVLRSGHVPYWHPDVQLFRGLWRKAFSHHFLNLAGSASSLALPVIVTAILPVIFSAYFYTAWMISNLILTVPAALTYTLYAIGSAQPHELARKTRMTLALSTLFGIAACGFVLEFGARMLALFGGSYAVYGVDPLHLMALAVFPVIVRHHYVAIQRVRGQLVWTALIAAVAGVPELVLAALGASLGGLPGMSLGWIIALYLETIPMAIVVWRVVKSSGVSAMPITAVRLAAIRRR